MFELSLEESEYRIQEGGPGETHVALRVCLVQRQEGAQSVELEGGRDSLSVSVTLNTHDGTATGRCMCANDGCSLRHRVGAMHGRHCSNFVFINYHSLPFHTLRRSM